MGVFIVIASVVAISWAVFLSQNFRCPECGTTLDKAGNERYCRKCRKMYHMDMFGGLKERR